MSNSISKTLMWWIVMGQVMSVNHLCKKKSKTDKAIKPGQLKLVEIFKKQRASSLPTSETMTVPEKLKFGIDHYI